MEIDTMNSTQPQRGPNWRFIALATLVTGVTGAFATVAMTGECPADKRVAAGQGQKLGPTMPKHVTDVVRSSTDLSVEPLALKGRLFRLRQLEMKPGYIVAKG